MSLFSGLDGVGAAIFLAENIFVSIKSPSLYVSGGNVIEERKLFSMPGKL